MRANLWIAYFIGRGKLRIGPLLARAAELALLVVATFVLARRGR
jgi:hypothetical protein